MLLVPRTWLSSRVRTFTCIISYLKHKKTVEKVSGTPKTEIKALMNLPCHQPSPFHLQRGCSCIELIGPLESGIGVTMLISTRGYNNFKIALYPHLVHIRWLVGPSCPAFYQSYPRPHKSLHHVCHCEPEKRSTINEMRKKQHSWFKRIQNLLHLPSEHNQ